MTTPAFGFRQDILKARATGSMPHQAGHRPRREPPGFTDDGGEDARGEVSAGGPTTA